MKKKKRLTLATKRAINGYMFILPWLIGFCMFYVKSLYMTIQFSVSEVTTLSADEIARTKNSLGFSTKFTGLDNLKYVFLEHPSFNQTLLTSLKDIVIDVPLILTFALLMAMLLNQKFFGRTVFRAIFFVPVIMGCEAIASAIDMARQAAFGGISSTSADIADASGSSINLDYYVSLFKDIGLPARIVDYVVGAVDRIAQVVDLSGVQIVIFIAALQSIPSSLYEVARIEGATGYETFWKVTFPMVMPHIITCLVYTVVDAFADSEVVKKSYDTIFTEIDYDIGSTMAFVSMLAVCAILFIVVALIQRKTFYYN